MKKGMVVFGVKEGSIAEELGLQKGDVILSVNGIQPKDIIELSFIMQDENINLAVKKAPQIQKDGSILPGEAELFEIEKDEDEDLGIDFECAVFDGIKPCLNKCIFCFVDQQPKGLRESLYVKDDDWRTSYLQGTYITGTNLKEEDWQRMEALRLSPMYVSIHTTNPDLRVKMLNNKRAGEILNILDRFKKIGVEIHGQIVLCPDINDGEELKRTLNDLKKYKKILKSLAVVPVGVSKYREGDILKPLTKENANNIIDLLDEFNLCQKRHIAMASDEIFITAEREIPDKKYYGNFVQIEDGVGSIRLLEDSFRKLKKKLKKKLKNKKKISILTGSIAAKLFNKFKNEIKVENLEIEILDVKNEFFGDRISVAGLITGGDILKSIKNKVLDHVVIPSVMLKEGTEEFLDGITISDIETEIKKTSPDSTIHINYDCYNFDEILTIINVE